MNDWPIEFLQRMPIFGAIREDTLGVLLQAATLRAVKTGGSLCIEGESASSMYVLVHGSAAVYKNWQGQEHQINRLQAGDCFGEMALMDLQPRSATVRAETECGVIELSAADLMRLFDTDVEQFALMQMNLGREVCRRLRSADEWLFRLRMTAPGQAH